jgi:hypothetical protein
MSSSTKGLKKRVVGYRESIEGWKCVYSGPFGSVGWWGWAAGKARSKGLGHGTARTLLAARAAARAVVMERETRGMDRGWPAQFMAEGLARFLWDPVAESWEWVLPNTSGSAPTLAEARKAAREAT